MDDTNKEEHKVELPKPTEWKHQSGLDDHKSQEDRMHMRIMSTAIVLSLVFGILGAIVGDVYVVPALKKTTAYANISPGSVTNVQVNEQSAAIDVVKQASPAVVSIIISKDLNQIQNNSASPFSQNPFSDPFFQFGSGSNNNNNSNTPNIQEIGGGSGFIITSDGMIATNKHVVEDTTATYTVLTNDGKKYDAQVLSRDPNNDIALVKIKASNLPTVKLGDSTNLQIGQSVVAIGNALGEYRNTVTSGIVSGISRTITAGGLSGSEQLEGVIQTDAAINPGNSGGPLLDLGGSVIGVNTAIDQQAQGVGFAIPINDIKHDIDSYNKNGQIIKPFLGVRYRLIDQTVQDENKLPSDHGAWVTGDNGQPAVVAGSAADKAGIKNGDIITQVDNQSVDANHSLAWILKNYNPGDTVHMKLLSNGQTKDITVILGQNK
jgi:serine protease Do